ncbi:DUF3572 domain-containing protein [Amaricoccus sp.]|uniref:DUF3572 domain-containing protein n=1 Tax=Amaricoccus sp. TaxID=1872485 RepID=UPI001B3D20CA|nr:DUF3572 domain-containing protein [Amaricoccus sp.]MBP7003281.1 DUF3572 domain-containing protein [Amaricoccus sp.]
MTEGQAAALAQEALIWLAGRPEALEAFLAASGAGPAEVRARAADPEFLGFVLDHVLASEAAVLDFALAAGVPPERVARARAALPGGYAPDWT